MDTGFLKKRAKLFETLFTTYELLLIVACFFIVHRITEGTFLLLYESLFVVQVTVLATYVVFKFGQAYRSARGQKLISELSRLLVCFCLIVMIAGLFAFLTKFGEIVSRLWFGFSMLLAFFLIAGGRLILRIVFRQLRKSGYNWKTVVIVGSGELSDNTVRQLEANPWVGLKIQGIFTDDSISAQSSLHKYRKLGKVSEIASYIETRRAEATPIDQVWITLPLSDSANTRDVVNTLQDTSVDVCVVPDFFGMSLLKGSIDEIGGVALINMSSIRLSGIDELLKRTLDIVISATGLVILLPVLMCIAIAIKLDSKGPFLFSQRRFGMNGKEISVLKFRTMFCHKDENFVKQATMSDDRITRVGAFLRSNSLDELPQLFNVLVGTMSLVGPRPHAISHNEEYREKISGYMMRHKVKPGITGWAQVNGWRGETETLEKMEKRVKFDLEYMENWSMLFDLKIMLLTLVRGFKNENAY